VCLEVAVPWADLQIPPDYPLRMILILRIKALPQLFT